MEMHPAITTLRQLAKALAILGGLGIIVPVLLGGLVGIKSELMIGFIVSVLLFQALSAAPLAGGVFGTHMEVMLLVMCLVAVSVILALFEICDIFGETSDRVAGWIRRIEDAINRGEYTRKYGDYVLVAVIWIPGIGLYGCAIVAWIFGWRRAKDIALMLTGWLIACLLVLAASMGLVTMIF